MRERRRLQLPVLAAALLAALSFPPLLAGCDGAVPEQPAADSGVPVTFDVTALPAHAQTRAGEITTANITSMGMFASLTRGDFAASSPPANYMYNQQVNKSGTWTYTPVKYWPNNAADRLSFFAYAPHGAEGLTPPAKTATGFPTLTYAVPQTEAAQTDLLAATPLMNRTSATAGGSGSVSFNMKHALMKVIFKVKNEAGADISISKLELKGRKTGTLNYHNPSGSSDDGFSWNNFTDTETFKATASTAPVTVPSTATTTAAEIATFYMLPDKSASTFSITYTITGSSEKAETDISLPTAPAWTAGAAVAYTMTIKPGNISEVTAEVSGVWESDGSGTAASQSMLIGADNLKIGDFYYSDGSWSDGGYRQYLDGSTKWEDINPVLNNPDTGNSRTVIGIVVKAGRGTDEGKTGQDRANADNWTEEEEAYKLKGSDTSYLVPIRGYVLALYDGNGGNPCAWGPTDILVGTDTKTYIHFCGYSNTQTIKKYATDNAKDLETVFPAAYHASEGNETREGNKYASPASSSGWFLPSAGQCWYWYKNKDLLLTNVRKATGDNSYDWQQYYWSSSESMKSIAKAVDFWNNDIVGDGKNTDSYIYVRSWLAF